MAFHNPVHVALFDENDKIIMPVKVPISITHNLQSFDFNYTAVQVETYDSVMREVLKRWANKELIQYQISGRWGVETGDVNSIYAYDDGGSGEFTFYGRNHKSLMNDIVGFIDPRLDAVQRTYSMTHKTYEGSALKVIRDVMTDNLVNRIGVPMTFPSGNLGNNVKVDFRFDEIHQHLYTDGPDRGGAQLGENGNIIIDIHRDFKAHKYVLTAREPVHHDQLIEMKSGLIDRWQITADRGEANRVIVGGPREMADRVFGSTEAAGEAPEELTVVKAERDRINANIKSLAKTREKSKATARSTRNTEVRKIRATRDKAISKAKSDYAAAIAKADKAYKEAMAKAKTDSQKNSAKYTKESAYSSAKSSRSSAIESANRDYKEDLKEIENTLKTDLKTADLAYNTDVKTQKQLLTTLLKQWPYPNRRFPAEMYTENTSPEGVKSDKLNPSDPQEKLNTIAEIATELNKVAVTKRLENGPNTDMSGELVESDTFYLGGQLRLGDYVKIGIDREIEIGEQQIEKAIVTWSKEDGYKVQLTKPDNTETTEEEALKRILSALKDLSTKTGRR